MNIRVRDKNEQIDLTKKEKQNRELHVDWGYVEWKNQVGKGRGAGSLGGNIQRWIAKIMGHLKRKQGKVK